METWVYPFRSVSCAWVLKPRIWTQTIGRSCSHVEFDVGEFLQQSDDEEGRLVVGKLAESEENDSSDWEPRLEQHVELHLLTKTDSGATIER